MNGIEGIIFPAQIVVRVRRAHEAPVEPVGPTMIAALDSSGEMSFGAGADARAAVPADIEKRPHRVTRVARNNDAFTGDIAKKIISRCGDLVGAPGADPVLTVEPL